MKKKAMKIRMAPSSVWAMAPPITPKPAPSIGIPSWAQDRDPTQLPSCSVRPTYSAPPKYEGDEALREAAAQKRKDRLKTRVAPMYNKGAYQLITEETDLSDIGRKK